MELTARTVLFGLFFETLFSLIPRNGGKVVRKGATITHSDKIFIFYRGFRRQKAENERFSAFFIQTILSIFPALADLPSMSHFFRNLLPSPLL